MLATGVRALLQPFDAARRVCERFSVLSVLYRLVIGIIRTLNTAGRRHPLDTRDVFASCVIFIVCFLSAAGGIGGGGVLVPVYVILKQVALRLYSCNMLQLAATC